MHLSLEGLELAPSRAQQGKPRPDHAVRSAHRQKELLPLLEQRFQRLEGCLGAVRPAPLADGARTQEEKGKTQGAIHELRLL